jgi:hypothetical protein
LYRIMQYAVVNATAIVVPLLQTSTSQSRRALLYRKRRRKIHDGQP